MKLAIFWAFLQHYHCARIRALRVAASAQNADVLPVTLCSRGSIGHTSDIAPDIASDLISLSDDPLRGGENSRWAAEALISTFERHQPDVVAIVGYGSRVSRAALAWCRRRKRAAVLMMETQRSDLQRSPWRECYKSYVMRGFDAALVGGRTHAAYARELGMPAERIRTGYDVVDNEFWAQRAVNVRRSAQEIRRDRQLPKRYFLAAGRFIGKKNFPGLLEAFERYCASPEGGKGWDLVLVGRGEQEARLRLAADSPVLRGRVHIRDYADAALMAEYYALSEAFVMPSSREEQWGLVVNEAMACGLPVFVSSVCGCAPDLVVENKTGFTFPPDDPAALAALFQAATRGDFSCPDMGREASRHIAGFSPRDFAEGLLGAAALARIHAGQRRINIWPRPALFV